MTENDPEHEDVRLRSFIQKCYPDAAIAEVEIQRDEANLVTLTIHTATPGAIMGARGQKVETVRAALEEKSGKKMQINVVSTSITQNEPCPNLDVQLPGCLAGPRGAVPLRARAGRAVSFC